MQSENKKQGRSTRPAVKAPQIGGVAASWGGDQFG